MTTPPRRARTTTGPVTLSRMNLSLRAWMVSAAAQAGQSVESVVATMREVLRQIDAPAESRHTGVGRCPVRWAEHDRCVRPIGHAEAHLTDRGFDWRTTAEARTR